MHFEGTDSTSKMENPQAIPSQNRIALDLTLIFMSIRHALRLPIFTMAKTQESNQNDTPIRITYPSILPSQQPPHQRQNPSPFTKQRPNYLESSSNMDMITIYDIDSRTKSNHFSQNISLSTISIWKAQKNNGIRRKKRHILFNDASALFSPRCNCELNPASSM